MSIPTLHNAKEQGKNHLIFPVSGPDPFSETLKALSGRIIHLLFGSGIFFSARSSLMALSGILSGGSFLYHGSFALYTLVEAVLCYDLSMMGANIASIHETSTLDSKIHEIFGDKVTAGFKRFERLFVVPEDLKRSSKLSNHSYAKGIVSHNTVLLRFAEPHCIDFLNWKNGRSIADIPSEIVSHLKH